GSVLANERCQNRVEALLYFRVGQRSIGGLEGQTNRKTDGAVRNALALITIEEANLDERRGQTAARGLNGATNDRGRQGVGDDDREIADDGWVARQRLRRITGRHALPRELVEVELSHHHAVLCRQSSCVCDRWPQRPDNAEPHTRAPTSIHDH